MVELMITTKYTKLNHDKIWGLNLMVEIEFCFWDLSKTTYKFPTIDT